MNNYNIMMTESNSHAKTAMAKEEPPKEEIYLTFDKMNLHTNLLRGIYANGFENPTEIQKRGIMAVCKEGDDGVRSDVIIQAQSGTGKTGTFAIATLQIISGDFVPDGAPVAQGGAGGSAAVASEVTVRNKAKKPYVQAIFLSPTRELAKQTDDVTNAIGGMMGIKTHICIGGTKVTEDTSKIREGIDIMIGTPGRVYDLLNRGLIDTKKLKIMVIDEADQMFDKGFKDQIYEIFKFMPDTLQLCLFSATMPPEVLEITRKFMEEPKAILVKKENVALSGIDQYKIEMDEEHKLATVKDLFELITMKQSIIFCNAVEKVEWLQAELIKDAMPVAAIHGKMTPLEREKVIKDYKAGTSKILITTDLLARGFDIQSVSLVINYDLPIGRETYIHRIGRSGRLGRKGLAINFVTPDNKKSKFLEDIESYYGVVIKEMCDPSTLGI
jgi:translation initiation factor 4A